MVSTREPAKALDGSGDGWPFPDWTRSLDQNATSDKPNHGPGEIMEPAPHDGMPDDVLIVEDDPIIALDFEDTLLGFGVKAVRTAGNVAEALDTIAERAPDFALLDVGLTREKSFAIAERLEALEIPFVFISGYGADVRLPTAFADRPRLPKPYSTDALKALLRSRAGKVTEG